MPQIVFMVSYTVRTVIRCHGFSVSPFHILSQSHGVFKLYFHESMKILKTIFAFRKMCLNRESQFENSTLKFRI